MTSTTHKFVPGSQDWHDIRAIHITATDMASLFGLNPNKSANRVMKEKREAYSIPDNLFMKVGRYLEPSVFIAMKENGMPAEAADPKLVVFVSNEEYRIGASMDGKMVVTEGFFIVEAKTTFNREKFMEWREKPPIPYWIQLQTQLLVCAAKKGLLACLYHGLPMPLVVYENTEHHELHNLMKEAAIRFWHCFDNDLEYKVDKDVKQRVLQIYEELLQANDINKVYVDGSEI